MTSVAYPVGGGGGRRRMIAWEGGDFGKGGDNGV